MPLYSMFSPLYSMFSPLYSMFSPLYSMFSPVYSSFSVLPLSGLCYWPYGFSLTLCTTKKDAVLLVLWHVLLCKKPFSTKYLDGNQTVTTLFDRDYQGVYQIREIREKSRGCVLSKNIRESQGIWHVLEIMREMSVQLLTLAASINRLPIMLKR